MIKYIIILLLLVACNKTPLIKKEMIVNNTTPIRKDIKKSKPEFKLVVEFFEETFPTVRYDYEVMNPATWEAVYKELNSSLMFAEYIGIICQESRGESGIDIYESGGDTYNISQVGIKAVKDAVGREYKHSDWIRAKHDGAYNALLGAIYYKLLYTRYNVGGIYRAKYCYNRGIGHRFASYADVVNFPYVKKTNKWTEKYLEFIKEKNHGRI